MIGPRGESCRIEYVHVGGIDDKEIVSAISNFSTSRLVDNTSVSGIFPTKHCNKNALSYSVTRLSLYNICRSIVMFVPAGEVYEIVIDRYFVVILPIPF